MYLCGPLVLLVEFELLLFFIWQPVKQKNSRTIEEKIAQIFAALRNYLKVLFSQVPVFLITKN